MTSRPLLRLRPFQASTSPSPSSASAVASPAGRTTRRRSGGCWKPAWTPSRKSPPTAGTSAPSTTPIRPGRVRPTAAGAASSRGSTVSTRTSSASRRGKRPAWTRSSGSCSKWPGRALEDAGLRLDQISGSRTAVFVGISSFDYSVLQTSFRDRGEIDVYSNTGGSLSIAANRISYCFDFRGPSAAVDTACSSALVAVHLACRSIWQDGCPLALAGGVNALLLPDWYVGFCRMGMLSPEGRCRAFDAGASGFVRSEGAGMVVLKPLAQALADGDRVYAVIRGTAMNQDGRTPGMTVPSQEAQEALLRQACRDARVAPATIQYVEAHGTGTLVGDPIEARALGRVLSDGRPGDQPCLIGSVKTNIGHLEAGAGIAGLIKVALALHHRRIPGNLHFDRPNPEIDFDALRLRVPTRCEPWPAARGPALAGVNAFGFGGTNAHVILQEAAPVRFVATTISLVRLCRSNGQVVKKPERRAWLVPLSARGPEALRAVARSWDEFLAQCPDDVSLEEIAGNAALRRTHHDHRLAVVAHSKQELAERLREFADGRAARGRGRRGEHRPIVGRGSPSSARGRGRSGGRWAAQLLREEPAFRAAIERCDAIVRTARRLVAARRADRRRVPLAHGHHRDLAALHLRAPGGAGRALGLLGRAAGGFGGAQRRRGGGRIPRRSVQPG